MQIMFIRKNRRGQAWEGKDLTLIPPKLPFCCDLGILSKSDDNLSITQTMHPWKTLSMTWWEDAWKTDKSWNPQVSKCQQGCMNKRFSEIREPFLRPLLLILILVTGVGDRWHNWEVTVWVCSTVTKDRNHPGHTTWVPCLAAVSAVVSQWYLLWSYHLIVIQLGYAPSWSSHWDGGGGEPD